MTVNWWFFAPEMAMVAAGLVVLSVDLVAVKERNRLLAYLSLGGIVLSLILTLTLVGTKGTTLSKMLVVDPFALFFKVVFLVSTFLVILLSVDTLSPSGSKPAEFYTFVLWATLGMMLITSTTDFIMIYIALELTSISSYVLAGYRRLDPKSNEAAMKYFLLGLLASVITLYGFSFIYGFTGFTELKSIAQALTPENGRVVIIMGMVLTLAGFSFKMATVPFHQWAPDTYEGAPTPVTAFFSVGPKIAALGVLIRILLVGFPLFKVSWQLLFIILSVVSMFVGNLLAVPQTNIKRMLAYSTIAHAGYMVMALAVASERALTGALIYAVVYLFMNLGAFGVVIAFRLAGGSENIPDYRGLSKREPVLALSMAIFLLSLTGIPPLAGFWGKLFVFWAAIEENLIWLATIGLINTLISLYYYVNVIRYMYLREPTEEKPLRTSLSLKSAIWIGLIGTLILGVYPDPLIKLSQISIKLSGILAFWR